MAKDMTCIKPIGDKHWEVRIRMSPGIFKRRVQGSADDAVAIRDWARVEIREGRDPRGREPGDPVPSTCPSLTSYLKPFLRARATKGKGRAVKPSTLKKDASALVHQILPEAGDWTPGEIRRRDIEDLIARWSTWERDVPKRENGKIVKDSEGNTVYVSELYSVEYVNTWLRVLRVYLRWVYDLEELGRSPAEDVEGLVVTAKRKPKRDKTVLTIEQMQTLLGTIRTHYPFYYPLFLLVLATGGSRVGEITALHWDDIDEDQKLIHIRHSQVEGHRDETKTGVEEVHALSDELAEILREHRRQMIADEHPGVATGIVFPAHIDPTVAAHNGYMQRWTLNDVLTKACEKAGVPRITPHRFRDFVDTRLMARGLHPTIVQSITGHSTDRMSVHYSHVSPAEKAAHLWPLLEEVRPK